MILEFLVLKLTFANRSVLAPAKFKYSISSLAFAIVAINLGNLASTDF
jgi:hypothetical protein